MFGSRGTTALAVFLTSLKKPSTTRRVVITLALALVVLIIAECVGRQATNELQDLLVGLGLAMVCWALSRFVSRERRAGLGLILGLWHAFRRWTRNRWFEVGVDLRRTPALPDSVIPGAVVALLLVEAGLAVLLVALAHTGIDARWFAQNVSYLVYLAALILVWALLITAFLFLVLVPLALIHDAFVCRHRGHGARSLRGELIALGLYYSAPLAGGLLCPVWCTSLLVVFGFTIYAASMYLPTGSLFQLIWRPRQGGVLKACRWRLFYVSWGAICVLLLVDLVLIALGHDVIGWLRTETSDVASAWITLSLGAGVAWLAGTGTAVAGVMSAYWLVSRWRRDPARNCPARVHVDNPLSKAQRRMISEALKPQGWSIAFAPTPADPSAVRIVVNPTPQPPDEKSCSSGWPLEVGLDALSLAEVQRRMARRDEIQRRRHLLRGLESLFKTAARYRYRKGSGFWLAPQFWFVDGMTRDVDEDELEDVRECTFVTGLIGPAYSQILTRASRAHLFNILHALEVDIIFVEDGVRFRQLRMILRTLFEHFDIHGGQQRVDEKHFRWLPGVRVIIHNHEIGREILKTGYREPDYETIGRARILHIHRDKGLDEDESPDVGITTGVPETIGVLV